MMCIVLTIVLAAYMLFDIHHFIRSGLTILIGKYLRTKLSMYETSTVYGIVLPSDVDFVLDHMSNARVLREFDFGRIDYGVRTGILEAGFRKKGFFPINASFIRYRLPVPIFSLYKIETRMLCWDSKYCYVEQKLITLKDGVVRAVAYPKKSFHGFDVKIGEIFDEVCPNAVSPAEDETVNPVNLMCDIISNRFKKSD